MKSVLAIVAAGRMDTPEATEFLRVAVALRACAIPVALVEYGDGTGALSREPVLEDDGERYLTALASNGILPASVSISELFDRIEAASDVLRFVGRAEAEKHPRIVRWDEVRDRPDAVKTALAAATFLRR
jgi:hypothetical protein